MHPARMNHRLLVVSDLHLGAPESRAEAPLVAFLDHHGRQRPAWTLVVNGDGLDLIALRVMPGEAGVVSGLDEDDHAYGLGRRERSAAAKMGVLLTRVPAAVAAFGRWVGAGHQIAFVAGNHDVELAWAGVQDVVRAAIVSAWKEQGGLTQDAAGARISFHPWFLYLPPLVWIEHGHQYDPYCSSDDPLTPAGDGEDSDLNVDSAVMRYLVAGYPDPAAGAWDRGFFGHLATLRSGHVRDRIAAYCTMVCRLTGVWVHRLFMGEHWRLAQRRRIALRAAATAARIPPVQLARVRRHHQRPLVHGLIPTLRAVMVDRLFAVLLAPIGVLAGAAADGWRGAWLGALVMAAAGLLAFGIGRMPVDPRPQLRRAGRAVRRLLGVGWVANGHTHAPETGSGVLNSGTWLPGLTAEGCTFLRFDHGRAELLRWNGTHAVPFMPTRAAARDASRPFPVPTR
jgi:UDP-2,3-diacylglucosamine pyrophosphatase LpxH